MKIVKATTDDVFDTIAKEALDLDGVPAGEWITQLTDTDDVAYDLMVEIAKNRDTPAFKQLVFIMESAIDAALWDRAHEI